MTEPDSTAPDATGPGPAPSRPTTSDATTSDGAAADPGAPAPMQVDSDRIVFIGTALWTLGFLVLLPFYGELGRHGHRIWLWTCLAGAGVGLFGYLITRRHRAAGRIT
jgi:hypothetical protein